MAQRSPTDPGPGQAGSASIRGEEPAEVPVEEEEPSAKAELIICPMPVGDGQGERPSGSTTRSLVRAKFIVPPRNVGQMLWAVTVISTLAIAVPVGIPYAMLVLILVIELAGFAACVLSAWRHRRENRR